MIHFSNSLKRYLRVWESFPIDILHILQEHKSNIIMIIFWLRFLYEGGGLNNISSTSISSCSFCFCFCGGGCCCGCCGFGSSCSSCCWTYFVALANWLVVCGLFSCLFIVQLCVYCLDACLLFSCLLIIYYFSMCWLFNCVLIVHCLSIWYWLFNCVFIVNLCAFHN